MQTERVVKFLGSQQYIAHKESRFNPKDDKDMTKNEAFLLSNPETLRKYTAEYDRIKDFFYGTPPSFEEVISSIQKHLNKM